jgi:hypothetical protein
MDVVHQIKRVLDYLARPGMFEEASYAYAGNVPNGLS